jgi:NAD(P)-dependent dehydrogenase (short-subunit alcohol dehydrogenase family)
MRDLRDKVAVVTGGASGIGLALARAFLREGLKVVVADIDGDALRSATERLGSRGEPVMSHLVDVSDFSSMSELADSVYGELGACHVLCNNAGVGAPSSKVWSTTLNDWRWVLGVNVVGVVNGILAFVPRMLEAGHEGHVVNTSSPDGPISPLPSASVYAASKAAVSTLSECLAAQLRSERARLGASVFYPSGGLLRTGLWTSERTRPPALAREAPRETPAMTPERLEEMARESGTELRWQPLDELAELVVAGIKEERFVIMLEGDRERSAEQLRARADAIGRGELPPTMSHLS